jgi:hypothetical protein
MSDEREQILSAVDYWRLHANDLKAEGGFAHMPVTDLRAILDHIDTLTRERDEAREERDALRENWSGLLIEQANLLRLREEAIQLRDEARKEITRLSELLALK